MPLYVYQKEHVIFFFYYSHYDRHEKLSQSWYNLNVSLRNVLSWFSLTY